MYMRQYFFRGAGGALLGLLISIYILQFMRHTLQIPKTHTTDFLMLAAITLCALLVGFLVLLGHKETF